MGDSSPFTKNHWLALSGLLISFRTYSSSFVGFMHVGLGSCFILGVFAWTPFVGSAGKEQDRPAAVPNGVI
jgi:hypothetical protein